MADSVKTLTIRRKKSKLEKEIDAAQAREAKLNSQRRAAEQRQKEKRAKEEIAWFKRTVKLRFASLRKKVSVTIKNDHAFFTFRDETYYIVHYTWTHEKDGIDDWMEHYCGWRINKGGQYTARYAHLITCSITHTKNCPLAENDLSNEVIRHLKAQDF